MPRLLCCYQCDIRIQNAMFSSVEPVEIPLLQMTSESKTSTNSKVNEYYLIRYYNFNQNFKKILSIAGNSNEEEVEEAPG